ncbi:hypothetical protein AAC387_Pa05g2140 [Persea americana]
MELQFSCKGNDSSKLLAAGTKRIGIKMVVDLVKAHNLVPRDCWITQPKLILYLDDPKSLHSHRTPWCKLLEKVTTLGFNLAIEETFSRDVGSETLSYVQQYQPVKLYFSPTQISAEVIALHLHLY